MKVQSSVICFYYFSGLNKISAQIACYVSKALTAIICSRWFSDVCIIENYFVIENRERLEYT